MIVERMKIIDLENGDLIFTKSSSEMSQAIQAATGVYNHVAIYFDGQIYHVTGDQGVVRQPLQNFLQPDEEYAVLAYPDLDQAAVLARAEQHLGQPYNASFYPQGQGFYCSQYIAEILPIFETIPMLFGDGQEEIAPFWQAYYQDLGLAVPLHQPGTNPSQLAQSDKLIFKGVLDD